MHPFWSQTFWINQSLSNINSNKNIVSWLNVSSCWLNTLLYIAIKLALTTGKPCRQVEIVSFYRNVQNSNFHCHIWIQQEKCNQMSTNKPSIGSVFLEIASWILGKIFCQYTFLYMKTTTSMWGMLSWCKRKKWWMFTSILRAISRTTEPILGLFALIWIHFSCWI